MITCPVCAAPNGDLDVVCVSCGGFLQQRIENLDLFATGWGLIERPARTFHTIAIARHKNFSLLLAAAAGIPLAFLFFRAVHAGEAAGGLLPIVAAALAAGPPAGIAAVLAGATAAWAAGAVTGAAVRWRNAFAVAAWGLLPVVMAGIVVVPLELLSFGEFLFSRNPGPSLLRPGTYLLLLGLDILFAAWALFLEAAGMRAVVGARPWWRALAVGAAALAPAAAAFLWLVHAFSRPAP